jgi:hypothetical protein
VTRHSAGGRALSGITAALVVAGVLAGCGDGGGSVFNGNGYDLEVPTGWSDGPGTSAQEIFERVGRDAPPPPGPYGALDAVVARNQPEKGPGTLVTVEIEADPTYPTAEEWAEFEIRLARERPRIASPSVDPATRVTEPPTEAESTTVDGEPAVALDYGLSFGGPPLRARQVLVVEDEVLYRITLQAAERHFEEALPGLEQMLDSWRWGD